MKVSIAAKLGIPVVVLVGGLLLHADQAPPLMRDFVGINGHTVQFKPELYQPVCRLVRDYHPVEWDLGNQTSEPPPFPFARNRVDWNHVYGGWRAKGWRIDVSLMFESIKQPVWKDLEADAKAYGRAFAHEFGPTGTRKLVDSVEIGNEPGSWKDDDYSRMFVAMAAGVREGDPAIKIATCNLTTGKSGRYEKSVECVAKNPELFDVLTLHTYAQLENWPTWGRSFPEDPKLPKYLRDVEALCRWRDEHAAGKPIWITEFGYDSTTRAPEKSGDFVKWVGVTDEQQAQWLVRSLLVFSAMPVERAYVYFFNDKDEPHLHASSGITRNFQPKPAYYALSHLQKSLGDYRFHHLITNEAGGLRIQEYRHGSDTNKFAWAVWSQSGDGKTFVHTLRQAPGKLTAVERMPLVAGTQPPPKPPVTQNQAGQIEVEVTESALYLFFSRTL